MNRRAFLQALGAATLTTSSVIYSIPSKVGLYSERDFEDWVADIPSKQPFDAFISLCWDTCGPSPVLLPPHLYGQVLAELEEES